MQGRMRVVLILSLVLVFLVSVVFSAPSMVDAPEAAETPQADEEKKPSDDKEDVQLQLAGKSDDDDDEPEINHQEVAKEFGLTGTDLEQLYNTWVPTVPDGEDSSFQTFLDWMEENDEPEDEGVVGPGTHYLRSIIKWTGKIINKANKKAKGQRSIDEEKPQMEKSKIAAVDKRLLIFRGPLRRIFQLLTRPRIEPRPRLEPRPSTITKAYPDPSLLHAYRTWLKTAGAGKDITFQKFAELFNNQKPRSLESELSDESKLPDKEIPEGEEKEKEVPVEESEPSDTNGGYSCEKNSPCNIENIVNEQFYFATTSTNKFIQCDAWGECHTLTCDDGLVWDDQIKTCGLRT